MALRQFDDLAPEIERVLVAGLQQHDALSRAIRESSVAVEFRTRGAIELAELAHVGLRAALTDVEQMLDEHTERRAPIADVVLADDLVAQELEHSCERVADDRGTQVAHVHFLGDVRRGIVDNDAVFRGRKRHAEALVARDFFERALEESRLEREVDEPGAGDLDAVGNIREVSSSDDDFGNLPWRTLQCFREAHREIGLIVGALGPANHRVDAHVLRAERGDDRALEPRGQHGAGIVKCV
jgi:hypothetical protein